MTHEEHIVKHLTEIPDDTLLTRIILLEKAPLRIRIYFKDIDECDWWYRTESGEIFDVKETTITTTYGQCFDFYEILFGEHRGDLIQKKDCKIIESKYATDRAI